MEEDVDQPIKAKRQKIDNNEEDEPTLHIPDDLAIRLSQFNTKSLYLTPGTLVDETKISDIRTLCIRNLPEWTSPEELRTLLLSRSPSGLETVFNNQSYHTIMTNIQVATDSETGKCIGYAFVEFKEHYVAAEMLANISKSLLTYPGSTMPLSVGWTTAPVAPSSVLDNYHFYIGNLNPGVTEHILLHTLKSIHPAVASVHLIPLELLGEAPNYVEKIKIPEDDFNNLQGKFSIIQAFYCDSPQVISESNVLSTPSQNQFQRRWSCGFIRLSEDSIHEWKSVLKILKTKINSSIGDQFRRELPNHLIRNKNSCHPYESIIIRVMFGKLDNSSSVGHTYTGPFITSKKSSQATRGGFFPKARPLNPEEALNSRESDKNSQSCIPQRKTSIFVGNLSDNTTDEDMKMLFSPFGLVVSSRVAFMKHVAFIEFADYRSVFAALSHLNKCTFKSNRLQLDWGRPQTLRAPVVKNEENTTRINIHKYETELLDKQFAREFLQSLQPRIKIQPPPKIKEDESEEEINKKKAFWLSALVASLPIEPSTP